MRRRRTIILIFGSFLAVALLVTFICLPSPEPVYDGKRLSEWLTEYQRGSFPEREKAFAALSVLDPKAMPLMFHWMQYDPYEPPRWQMRLQHIASRMGLGGMRKWLDNGVDQDALDRAYAAVKGFSALGPGVTN